MTGTFTGEFEHEGKEINQFMNCACPHCGGHWDELFKVISEGEEKITPILSVDTHEESNLILICNGFGMPLAEIPNPVAQISAAWGSLND